jgi:hypothetical protein
MGTGSKDTRYARDLEFLRSRMGVSSRASTVGFSDIGVGSVRDEAGWCLSSCGGWFYTPWPSRLTMPATWRART